MSEQKGVAGKPDNGIAGFLDYLGCGFLILVLGFVAVLIVWTYQGFPAFWQTR